MNNMLENEKCWYLDKEKIYRLKYPKELTLENTTQITSELIQDYIKNSHKLDHFLVLIDGSQVEKYEASAIIIAVAKVEEWFDGRVAVYNMSPYYKKTIDDFFATHEKLPNIKYFNTENEARNWLIEETNSMGLNLE